MSKETACLVCLDDDSLACIDRARLSDSLFVKFSVACLNRSLRGSDILLQAIVERNFCELFKVNQNCPTKWHSLQISKVQWEQLPFWLLKSKLDGLPHLRTVRRVVLLTSFGIQTRRIQLTTVIRKERPILDRRLGKLSRLESNIHLLHLGRHACSGYSLCYDAVLEEKQMRNLKNLGHLGVSRKTKFHLADLGQ